MEQQNINAVHAAVVYNWHEDIEWLDVVPMCKLDLIAVYSNFQRRHCTSVCCIPLQLALVLPVLTHHTLH